MPPDDREIPSVDASLETPTPTEPVSAARAAQGDVFAACRHCGARSYREVMALGPRQLLGCTGCGLVRLDPVPTAAELSEVYDGGDYYTTQPPVLRKGLAAQLQDSVLQVWWGYPGRLRGVRRLLVQLLTWPLRHRFMPLPFPGAAPVLDIGCGNGQRLLELQNYGCQALYGVEPTAAAAEQARNHTRADVRACLLEEARLPQGQFGLVILNQVLEHVPSPPETLAVIHRLLAGGGRLYLTVPNFGSFEARWAGPHWDGLQIPAHLHHFTAAPLRGLLEEAGYRIEQWRTDSVTDVSRNTWRALRASGSSSWAARLPWRGYQLMSLLADRLGRGQMLRVVARKSG